MPFLKGFQFKSYNTAEKRGSEERFMHLFMILLLNTVTSTIAMHTVKS